MSYQPQQFKQQMIELGYENKIKKMFGDDILLIYDLVTVLNEKKSLFETPREDWVFKKFSVIPLWYLNFLIEQKPATIVDIGCGANLFKPVIKTLFDIDVHGIDPRNGNPAADENDFFDSIFSKGHVDMYKSAFSINALHFIPLSDFSTRVNEFYNVISPGGWGFLSLNSARMIDHSSKQCIIDIFGIEVPTQNQIEEYILNQLHTLDIEFVVKDILISKIHDDYMDGNIRLVFKK
jgi:hypothetical protein